MGNQEDMVKILHGTLIPTLQKGSCASLSDPEHRCCPSHWHLLKGPSGIIKAKGQSGQILCFLYIHVYTCTLTYMHLILAFSFFWTTLHIIHYTTRKSFLTWGYYIEEIFELIHPDLCQAPVVLVDDVPRATREGVRCCFAENVANMRAGDDLEGATTLPNLKSKHAENVD